MPAQTPDFFPVRLREADLAAALDHLRKSTSAAASWQSALNKAARYLPKAQPCIRRADGALVLTSPASGNRYALYLLADDEPAVAGTDDHRKCCIAVTGARPRVCWHIPAALIIRCCWDACQPRWRCAVCRGGPMILTTTPAGERCAECLVCGATWMHSQGLRPWPRLAERTVRTERRPALLAS